MKPATKPIGYLIKELDKLLSEKIDEVQKACGISRIDWQVLNSISEAEQITGIELSNLMQPFIAEQELNILLQKLISGYIITRQAAGQYMLTDQGVELYRKCLKIQQNFRQKLMQNVTETAYSTTIQTLGKMIENIS